MIKLTKLPKTVYYADAKNATIESVSVTKITPEGGWWIYQDGKDRLLLSPEVFDFAHTRKGAGRKGISRFKRLIKNIEESISHLKKQMSEYEANIKSHKEGIEMLKTEIGEL